MKKANKAVMIFAAGFGTRMMPLTEDRPKPMISVMGKPLFDYAHDHAIQFGADPIVTNLHYKADVLQTHLRGSDVVCVVESPDILDTGGGLKHAMPQLNATTVFTMNPDALWFDANPLSIAADAWDPAQMDALLVCVDPKRAFGTDSAGDFVINIDGALTRGTGFIYGGVQVLKTACLETIPDRIFSLNRVWDHLIAQRRCFGITYPGTWCDVGTPHGLQVAEEMLQNSHV